MPAAQLRDIDHVRDVLDRLRLDKDARRHGAIVVEGTTDAAILSRALTQGVRFFPVAGRVNVLRAADSLEHQYLQGVVCVADTDFDDESIARAHLWFLVFSDRADLEAMVFFSSACDRVFEEWGSSEKLKAIGGVRALQDTIHEALRVVAVLRHQNWLDGLGIAFDAVDLKDVADRDTLTIKAEGLYGRLSRASTIEIDVIRDAADGPERICVHTAVRLTRGGDYIQLATVALRKLVGSLSAQQAAGGLVEKSLRLAVQKGDLDGTPFLTRLEAALVQALATPDD